MMCDICNAEYPHTEHQLCYYCGKKVAVPEGIYAFPNSTCCAECDDKLTRTVDGIKFRFLNIPRYDLIRARENE